MQAKDINVIIDRNEWLNHLYPDDVLAKDFNSQKANCQRLPPISMVGKGPWQDCRLDKDKALQYAQLVAEVNKAQLMFHEAYKRFMGVDAGQTLGSNSGPGSLQEILSEI